MENGQHSEEDITGRTEIIRHKLKFIQQKPTVAVLSAFAPLIFEPEILDDKISTAGGVAVNGADASAAADILIICVPGYEMARLMSQLSGLIAEKLTGFAAVQNNALYVIDPEKTGDKNSILLLESLAEIIQPKQFVFRYEGDLWIRFVL